MIPDAAVEGRHLGFKRVCHVISIHVYEQALHLLEKQIPHAAQQQWSQSILHAMHCHFAS